MCLWLLKKPLEILLFLEYIYAKMGLHGFFHICESANSAFLSPLIPYQVKISWYHYLETTLFLYLRSSYSCYIHISKILNKYEFTWKYIHLFAKIAIMKRKYANIKIQIFFLFLIIHTKTIVKCEFLIQFHARKLLSTHW